MSTVDSINPSDQADLQQIDQWESAAARSQPTGPGAGAWVADKHSPYEPTLALPAADCARQDLLQAFESYLPSHAPRHYIAPAAAELRHAVLAHVSQAPDRVTPEDVELLVHEAYSIQQVVEQHRASMSARAALPALKRQSSKAHEMQWRAIQAQLTSPGVPFAEVAKQVRSVIRSKPSSEQVSRKAPPMPGLPASAKASEPGDSSNPENCLALQLRPVWHVTLASRPPSHRATLTRQANTGSIGTAPRSQHDWMQGAEALSAAAAQAAAQALVAKYAGSVSPDHS